MSTASVRGFRGELLSAPEPGVVRHDRDGLLVVEDGLVVARGPYDALAPRFAAIPVARLPGLIVPGFVDAHVHFPQIDRIASHGLRLLDWLDTHIFPEEARFADRAHAEHVAGFFLDQLLAHGTTSALIFSTVHAHALDGLFEAALTRDMRIVSGKTLMDLGPPDLRDAPGTARAASEALIARWRGRGRLGYAITPRFALSCSDAQLAVAGELLAAHPDTLLHTHLAENAEEVAAVAARFPQAADYLDVYDRYGLVTGRSVFAHGVHLEHRALGRMAAAGAGIAFCPSSNLFLGSGLFDLARVAGAGVHVGIGSDVGAGTSLSLLHTLGEAYKVCQLRGLALDPFHALHLATAGGAALLGLGTRIGSLAEGQEADFVVLDMAATPLLARRTAHATLAERLFALQVLGDDRAVAATYLRGEPAWRRPSPPVPE